MFFIVAHTKVILKSAFPALSLIAFLVFLGPQIFAQKKDSIKINNFNSGDYRASDLNYAGTVDKEGVLFFANENGVLKYDGSEWELIPITNFAAVFEIHITENNKIFIGGRNEFGYLKKDQSNKYQYISLRETISASINLQDFWQIEDINDNVYFASYEGIVRYNNGQSSLISINNSGIFKIDNSLYISRIDDGIYKVKNDSTFLFNDQFHFNDDYVYSALPSLDSDNLYLLYTSENGLFNYDPVANSMTLFIDKNNPSLKGKVLYDGHVWNDSLYIFTTWYSGLILMNKDGDIVREYNANNGLLVNELLNFVIDSRENIWITCNGGVIHIKWPNSNSSFKAHTLITNVISNYTENQLLKSIEFHFATPGYDKSDLDYSFILKGYDDEFSGWKNDVKKEYTNLPGGSYEFMVKAKLPGDIQTELVSHKFEVPLPWYKNPLYYLIFLIAGSLLIYTLFKLRTMRLKSLNQRLEKIIDNRTQELILQREQLKKTNEELVLRNTELDNFVYRSSHDLVAPLKSLKGLISLAKTDSSGGDMEEYLNFMNASVVKLEDFIKSIMEYSVNTKQNIVKKTVRLDDLIEDIRADLKYFDQAEKVSLIKNYDIDLQIKTDGSRLKIVLSNLITNCIKYHNYGQENPKVEVNVQLDYEEKIAKIEILDNGLGIDESHLEQIFEMFFRASNNKVTGSGLGLYIVKDTINKIGGKIDVDSKLGEGTSFTITLFDSIDTMIPSSVDSS